VSSPQAASVSAAAMPRARKRALFTVGPFGEALGID
jgi:hypothetical protein